MNRPDRELDNILADHFSESSSPRRADADDDADFAAEMQQLLAEGEEAVFAGIDPEVRRKMSAPSLVQRIPRRRLYLSGGAVAAAAGVLFVALFARPSAQTPNGALEIEVGGGLSENRGGHESDAVIPRYGPNNDLSIQFTETKVPNYVPANIVRAYLVGLENKLSPLAVRTKRIEEEGVTTFTIEGRAGVLFGAISGIKTLAIAFAARAEDLEGLNGLELEQAQKRAGVRWSIQRIEFIRPSGAKEIRLVRYARLVGEPGRAIPVFTRQHLPRIQVYGHDGEAWGLQIRIGNRQPERVAAKISKRGSYLLLDVQELAADLMEPGELELVLGDERVAKWPMVWAQPADDDPAIAQAGEAARQGNELDAEKILAKAATGRGWSAYYAEVALGRMYLRRGSAADAWKFYQAARHRAEELGAPTEAAARLRACAWIDLEVGQFDRASEEIALAGKLSSGVDDHPGISRAEYLDALLLQKRNTPNASLVAQQKYARLMKAAYERGDDDDASAFAMLLATALAEQGNTAEARQLLSKHRPPAANARALFDYALNAAYVERLAFESDGRPARAADGLRTSATSLLEQPPADVRPSDRAYVFSDIIRYSLALGDLATAEKVGHALRELDSSKLLGARWDRDLILAELELRAGRLDRLEQLIREIQQRAESEDGPGTHDVSFLAETLIGEAKLQLGDRKGAEAVFRSALERANDLARHFAVPRARESYRSRRAETERRLAAMLIEDHRAEEALLLIENSRARAVAELAAQIRVARAPDAWREYVEARAGFERRYVGGCAKLHGWSQRSCSALLVEVEERLSRFYVDAWTNLEVKPSDSAVFDLRMLPAGSALLSIARSPVGTLSLFAKDGTTRAVIVRDDPIAPWDGELESVQRVYLSVDDRSLIEELPLRTSSSGEPFGTKLEIVMLAHGTRSDNRLASTAWLVVADPRGDLPEAKKEGIDVAGRGRNAHLYTAEQADQKVISALAEYPALFHFSGHGNVTDSDPWAAQLELSGKQQIRIQDVLAERLAADLVVLNGCMTGAIDGETRFGLPEAFIAAGARYVLATLTSVSDVSARRFIDYFYKFGGMENPPAAFRQAFMEMWRMGEHVSFRLWGR